MFLEYSQQEIKKFAKILICAKKCTIVHKMSGGEFMCLGMFLESPPFQIFYLH